MRERKLRSGVIGEEVLKMIKTGVKEGLDVLNFHS
jgi:hypothetical protein